MALSMQLNLVLLLLASCVLSVVGQEAVTETVEPAPTAETVLPTAPLFASPAATPACTEVDYTSLCFVQRVRFLEGLILFGVLIFTLLGALTCMAALTTPTRFAVAKERSD